MTGLDYRIEGVSDLRRQAKEIASKDYALKLEDITVLSPEDISRKLYELRVHQIELELQNEELRAVQAELEESRERYFDLYDLAPVGYCTISQQGLILEANLTAATLLGLARSFLAKKPLSQFILKQDQDIYYLHHKKLFETGEPQECELRLLKADGTTLWTHLRGSTVQAKDEEPSNRCRVVINDISKRKQIDEKLQRVLSEKDKLFSIIAHDLRSPMVGFVGIARLLANGITEWSPNKLQEVFSGMKNSAETLFLLLENLLEWSSLQCGKIELEPVEINLKDMVKNNTDLTQTMADQKSVALKIIVPESFNIFADPHMLNTVLRNLISNAVKFSKTHGTVVIKATQSDDMVTVSVQDNGIGMDQQLIDKIFSTDHKTWHSGKSGGKGSGLGLILCREFVEKHGGQIWAESIPDQGSRFFITLPVLKG
ncbi:PAS domain-containing sensor histidine kinase [Desulfonatronovibrio magnus]|uniref:PAS domain-containing sensor histidine kinase n=1 Tax=Desulfonatronovibrio magnus TaxID=698827 RepID=UPI0005EAED89|nr:PAS domain-containing sensor histidine kinase [Desulfonatronovibrio magnus]